MRTLRMFGIVRGLKPLRLMIKEKIMKKILLIITIVFLIFQMIVLATEWDVSTATYVGEGSAAAETTQLYGIHIKSDGTKMFVTEAEDEIFQYTLTTPWLVSSLDYDSKSYDTSTELSADNRLRGIAMKPDGTEVYVCDNLHSVIQYTLGTPWDISTCGDAQEYNPQAQTWNTCGIYIRADGLKMYLLDSSSDDAFQYTLGTAWDVTTAGYDAGKTFSFTNEEASAIGIFLKTDGTKVYILGAENDTVYQYSLDPAWDISTASYDTVFKSVTVYEDIPSALFIKMDDGAKMYVGGVNSEEVTEYSMAAAPPEEANAIWFAICF